MTVTLVGIKEKENIELKYLHVNAVNTEMHGYH